jgi:hypothetical protein
MNRRAQFCGSCTHRKSCKLYEVEAVVENWPCGGGEEGVSGSNDAVRRRERTKGYQGVSLEDHEEVSASLAVSPEVTMA